MLMLMLVKSMKCKGIMCQMLYYNFIEISPLHVCSALSCGICAGIILQGTSFCRNDFKKRFCRTLSNAWLLLLIGIHKISSSLYDQHKT